MKIVLISALALLLGISAAQAQVTIAVNPATGKAAGYNGSWDADVVKRQALDNCGAGCRIVASGKKTCAALVESISTGGSAWAVGYGTTTRTAAQNAWHECRRKGGSIATPRQRSATRSRAAAATGA